MTPQHGLRVVLVVRLALSLTVAYSALACGGSDSKSEPDTAETDSSSGRRRRASQADEGDSAASNTKPTGEREDADEMRRAAAGDKAEPDPAAGSGGAKPAGVAGNAGNSAGAAGNGERMAGAGGAGASANQAACDMCQSRTHDGLELCPETVAACEGLQGNTSAASPVRPGAPRGALCHEILTCMQSKGCAKQTTTDCLCGAGADPNACFGGPYAAMQGPCKELIAAGIESTNPVDLQAFFIDEMNPVGAAVAVVELCDQMSCAAECL